MLQSFTFQRKWNNVVNEATQLTLYSPEGRRVHAHAIFCRLCASQQIVYNSTFGKRPTFSHQSDTRPKLHDVLDNNREILRL
jgi:hypothetical protein